MLSFSEENTFSLHIKKQPTNISVSRLFFIGAGSGNRTRIASLEGWNSTIELHPQNQYLYIISLLFLIVKGFFRFFCFCAIRPCGLRKLLLWFYYERKFAKRSLPIICQTKMHKKTPLYTAFFVDLALDFFLKWCII